VCYFRHNYKYNGQSSCRSYSLQPCVLRLSAYSYSSYSYKLARTCEVGDLGQLVDAFSAVLRRLQPGLYRETHNNTLALGQCSRRDGEG
jgi:hypothetical protein